MKTKNLNEKVEQLKKELVSKYIFFLSIIFSFFFYFTDLSQTIH
jgi:hypothetical protein